MCKNRGMRLQCKNSFQKRLCKGIYASVLYLSLTLSVLNVIASYVPSKEPGVQKGLENVSDTNVSYDNYYFSLDLACFIMGAALAYHVMDSFNNNFYFSLS